MSELQKCMKALETIGMSRVEKSANMSPRDARARVICKAAETPAGA